MGCLSEVRSQVRDELERREPNANFQRASWYPNKRQWWVIWIVAILIVVGLLNRAEGVMFAFCAAHFFEVLMSARAPVSKLAELRGKTDRELVRVIDNAVEVGLLLAGTQRVAERLHAKAEHIYADSLMLLPKVEDVNERQRLEDRVKLLGEMLEQQCVVAVCV
jgi:MFS superfamily sulfate permease-like transporter